MRCSRVGRAHDQIQLLGREDDRERRIERGLDDEPVTHAKSQQVFDRDGPPSRNCLVERPVDALQDLAVGELRKEPVDGLINCELAVLDEHHRGRGEDRLGHRCDAKDGVAAHRLVTVKRHHAHRVDVHVLITSDQSDHPGELALRDASGHGIVQTAKAGLLRIDHPHNSNACTTCVTCLILIRPTPWRFRASRAPCIPARSVTELAG